MVVKWLTSRLRRILRRRKELPNSRLVSGGDIGEEIHLDSLIYPLRYDIIVRAEFMAYYQRHRDTYSRDFEAFLAHPTAQDYFTAWFTDARRSRPELSVDQSSLRKEFEFRVRRAIKLFDSLQAKGFNFRHPIELRAASLIRHEHQKHVTRRFYAGDGCHRLAYLASKGSTALTPNHYCIRVFDEFRPRDNTYLLLGTLLRTEEEYCRIMSKYYCNGIEFEDPHRILAHVGQYNPSLLDEVASAMRVDLRRIAETKAGTAGTVVEGQGSARVAKA